MQAKRERAHIKIKLKPYSRKAKSEIKKIRKGQQITNTNKRHKVVKIHHKPQINKREFFTISARFVSPSPAGG